MSDIWRERYKRAEASAQAQAKTDREALMRYYLLLWVLAEDGPLEVPLDALKGAEPALTHRVDQRRRVLIIEREAAP